VREAQVGHAHEPRAPREHPSGLPGRGPGLEHVPVPTEAETRRRGDRCAEYTRREAPGDQLLAGVLPASLSQAALESQMRLLDLHRARTQHPSPCEEASSSAFEAATLPTHTPEPGLELGLRSR